MRELKDSGIEWIGKVPSTWIPKKIKNAVSVIGSGTTPPSGNFLYYDDGSFPWIQSGDIYGKLEVREASALINDIAVKLLPALKIYTHDFIIIAMYGGSVGNIAISKIDACVNQAYCCIKPDNQNYIKFMYYWISMCKQDFLRVSEGGGQPNISQAKIKNQYYMQPSFEEQKRIADFLDAKCTEIDDFAADIRSQIDTLEQYRRSVITKAVTKGLDSDAEMRDSGIDCVSLIPEKWKASRFKYIAVVKSNLVSPEGYEDYPQVSPDNIEKNSGRLLSYNTVEEAGVISGNHLFFAGQILYSKIRPNLNKVTIAPFNGLCSADMYPIETDLDVRFVVYMMLSNYFVEQVSLVIQDRVKMPKINQDELGRIRVVVPPDNEQCAIADFLDGKCAEIDAVIADKKQQMEVLAEYKKSLIFEYVTGKKAVVS